MSILTGFKKFKDYIKTDAGYVLSSRWTKSDSVIMGDGSDDTNTLEKNCGAIHGITDSLTSESSNIAASAKAVKEVNDSLAGCWISFTDEEGNATTEPYIHWYEEVADEDSTEVTA
ncbi:MAG: tail fiber protein [Lachnospiraceae bacterium]|nr:tail fiber protein [Lachnospiraceae bacterium]MBQ7781112.1 tail fiber protein [Lachnospiraceae bacterium]